jgi:ATP-dependent Lhr-like helicase
VGKLESVDEPGGQSINPLCRIGLSATAAPLDSLARFLVGDDRPCIVAEAQAKKKSIVEVFSPIRRDPYPPAGYTGVRLYAELADLIRRQQSVLVFTNVRSAAEQIGLKLKELLPELSDQIETHHASLDRSVRLEVEDRLKNGELRAVVCSTSLELRHRYWRCRSCGDGGDAEGRFARHPGHRPVRAFAQSQQSWCPGCNQRN